MDTHMLALSTRIRNQPNWTKDRILPEKRRLWHKWGKGSGLCNDEVAFVLDELEYYAGICKPEHGMEVGCFDMIWTSDILVDKELCNKLAGQFEAFKQRRDNRKYVRWHCYWQDVTTLCVVCPSSNMLDFNRTRIHEDMQLRSPEDALKYVGCGKRPESTKEWEKLYARQGSSVSISWGFMNALSSWRTQSVLPSEVYVDAAGNARFMTYINNIHPIKHKQLYTTIERALTAVIPLFEELLTDMVYPLRLRIFEDISNGIDVRPRVPEINKISDTFIKKYSEWYHKTKFVPLPSGKFTMPKRPSYPFSLRRQRLQVVVGSTEYIVPPTRSNTGDVAIIALNYTFKVPNERIIAAAACYYKMENISSAKQGVSLHYCEDTWGHYHDHENDMFSDGQGDEHLLDLQNDTADRTFIDTSLAPSCSLGKQNIKEGTCLCFSALYDSNQLEVELVDLAKQGIIKDLAFYLVDPSVRRISTEIVPPQQTNWWMDEIFSLPFFQKIPWLIVERIKYYISNDDGFYADRLVRDSICTDSDGEYEAIICGGL
ncbi:hypothetical protein BX070DRAFT_218917 [Coemansia spiralis]|nr:hypothetical protein BX070DRAFT_218917 [Coemansia spiralis]